MLLFVFSACTPSPEPNLTPTSTPIKQKDIDLQIGEINISYIPSATGQLKNNFASFDRNDLSIASIGTNNQLPCGTEINLLVNKIEIDQGINNIKFIASDKLEILNSNISFENSSGNIEIDFVSECPSNSLQNTTFSSKISISTGNNELSIDLLLEFFKPVQVDDLLLPFNSAQMLAAINTRGVHLEYKAETRPKEYARGPHLGDMIEIASDSRSTSFPDEKVEVLAPIDIELVNLWGFDHRLICLNGFIGYTDSGRKVFYSMYHIDTLEPGLKTEISNNVNIAESELVVSENGFEDQVFHPNIRLAKDEVIGYLDHFESSEYWGTHIASQLHVNLTHTSPTDNLEPYDYAIDFSSHYLTLLFDEFSNAGFRFVLDEGFSENGKSFSESNPPSTDDVLEYLPVDAVIKKLDWRTYVVDK